MDSRFLFHTCVILAILATAALPLPLLRRGALVIPFAVSLLWVLAGKCVLGAKEGEDNDTTVLLRLLFPSISNKTANDVVVATTVLLPTIMAFRCLHARKRA